MARRAAGARRARNSKLARWLRDSFSIAPRSYAPAVARARARVRPLRIATGDTEETLNPPGAGTPLTWRARVDQFAEHLSEFRPADEAAIAALASRFQFVPPAGFLPRGVLDFLTTAQAVMLPPPPGQPPDRAGINHFFPASFAVEAVPVATEDLDSALAASAPLAPYDFTDPDEEDVRVLVPLPQRVFDPQLLVVEQEDPIFAETVARFAATRQGWRQRRDFVLERRDVLQDLTLAGRRRARPPASIPASSSPSRQRTFNSSRSTLRSCRRPPAGAAVEIGAAMSTELDLARDSSLFFWLRVDDDAPPARIEGRWAIDKEEARFAWTQPLPAVLEPVDASGQPAPFTLWRHLTFQSRSSASGAAASSASPCTSTTGASRSEPPDTSSTTTACGTTFSGGPRTAPSRSSSAAIGRRCPTRDSPIRSSNRYEAVFPDGQSLTDRLAEIQNALDPPGATPRVKPLPGGMGLDRILAELEAEASEADDFVDTHFTRAQVNLYRIRKLMLGQTAAQKLLVNPAIAAIAEQETATASADQLGAFIAAAKAKKVPAADVTAALERRGPAACVR